MIGGGGKDTGTVWLGFREFFSNNLIIYTTENTLDLTQPHILCTPPGLSWTYTLFSTLYSGLHKFFIKIETPGYKYNSLTISVRMDSGEDEWKFVRKTQITTTICVYTTPFRVY